MFYCNIYSRSLLETPFDFSENNEDLNGSHIFKILFFGIVSPTRLPPVQTFYKLNIDIDLFTNIFKFRKKDSANEVN